MDFHKVRAETRKPIYLLLADFAMAHCGAPYGDVPEIEFRHIENRLVAHLTGNGAPYGLHCICYLLYVICYILYVICYMLYIIYYIIYYILYII